MIRTRLLACFAASLIVAFLTAASTAQVHGPGPSDSSLFDSVINLPLDQVSIDGSIGNSNGELTPTTQLNVAEGGSVGHTFMANAGSEVNVTGGSVGSLFGAESGSEVNISGGHVGNGLRAYSDSVVNVFGGTVGDSYAYSGSEVNISGGLVDGLVATSGSVVSIDGGTVGENIRAESGSVVHISGGSLGYFFRAFSGSEVKISGGNLGHNFFALPGSKVHISGGSFGTGFQAQSSNNLELIGGEFKINGDVIDDPAISLTAGDVFTGTLADGSTFLFSTLAADSLFSVTLTKVPLPPLDTTRQLVSSNVSATAPSGLRTGQVLMLQPGGVLGESFAVVDATLNIAGGVVGSELESTRSEVNIFGGRVGGGFRAFSKSVVNIRGGRVDDFFRANSGAEVNISGGSVGEFFQANTGSSVNISGGSFGDSFLANADSEVNLYGSEFFLDGEPLDTLVQGNPFAVTNRNGATLSGTLADGSGFRFILNDLPILGEDRFDKDAFLTVTLVPEPTSAVLLLLACGELCACWYRVQAKRIVW